LIGVVPVRDNGIPLPRHAVDGQMIKIEFIAMRGRGNGTAFEGGRVPLFERSGIMSSPDHSLTDIETFNQPVFYLKDTNSRHVEEQVAL